MHATSAIDREWKDQEGFSAHRRWKGREFTKSVAEFGQRVSRALAMSVGKGKFGVRWKERVWLGTNQNGEWRITDRRERRTRQGERLQKEAGERSPLEDGGLRQIRGRAVGAIPRNEGRT